MATNKTSGTNKTKTVGAVKADQYGEQAQLISEALNKAQEGGLEQLKAYAVAGQQLQKVKDAIGRGQWSEWLSQFRRTPQQARRYMRLHAGWKRVEKALASGKIEPQLNAALKLCPSQRSDGNGESGSGSEPPKLSADAIARLHSSARAAGIKATADTLVRWLTGDVQLSVRTLARRFGNQAGEQEQDAAA